jgi:hypothetical protein
MSWRTVQLGHNLCDQDRLIIDLFKEQSVRYIGHDLEFKKHLNCDDKSSNLILIFNTDLWCSEIKKNCLGYLSDRIEKFYIGINRYKIIGNDTDHCFSQSDSPGNDIINMIKLFVAPIGLTITSSGTHDFDRGCYFNFVQPLTWMYGTKTTN